ncbi:hypothetical protein COTS27_01017 [Spirochaetota bacterium]|nr:hypothetical protein COTS27_01017 [Spirochaetota bacterium]
MNPLQKSMLKISQGYLNFNRFALILFLCITIMTSCTTTSSEPSVPSPLEVGDITVVPSGGETSPYAAAIATIEGAVIVVSGITNLADARSETLTLSIADRDNPATYTVEPSSIVVPATALNPDGTAAVANRLEGVQFVLTPVAAGSEAITYSIEVRLAEFVAPPSRLPAFAVEDITITPSGGDTSLYAAATPTIEGDTIIISGIANLADVVRTETLTVSIADTDSPADYTAEPSSVTIPANVLNPNGIGGMSVAVPGVAFVLTPVAVGGTAVTFNVELRLDGLTALPPLEIADIAFDSGRDPAYVSAMVSSIVGNVIAISGIKNKEDGFSADLMLTISSSYRVTDRGTTITGTDNTLILAGASLNPTGVASTTTAMDNESLSFTVTSAGGQESASEKYYVQLMLGDLIQLRLLGGNAGDFASEVVLSEGTSSPGMTATLKDCGVVTGSPSHQVLVGGSVSTAYTLTGTVNAYVASAQTNFVLSQGSLSLTFPLSISSPCTQAALSGTGASGTPYIIDNDRKLNLVAELVNSNTGNYRTAHYRVAERIDLGVAQAPWSEISSGTSGSGFMPIGRDGTNFAGTFDCDEKVIANLYINRRTTADIGLFGYTSGAMIQDCRLADVKVAGGSDVGGLIGQSTGSTMVTSSYVTGSVRGFDSSRSNVGGLVGINSGSTVSNSYVNGDVAGIYIVGGLVGHNIEGTIKTSYAAGSVEESPSSTAVDSGVGGLVGVNTGSASTITDSYAASRVQGIDDAGGLVGRNSNSARISASYSSGFVDGAITTGGLVGVNSGMVTSSYWDTTATGQSGSAGGTSQTTTQLQSATSYTGWDSAIWQFTPNNQYPRLETVVCANRQYNQAATECMGL